MLSPMTLPWVMTSPTTLQETAFPWIRPHRMASPWIYLQEHAPVLIPYDASWIRMVSSMTLFRGMTSPKTFLQPILQQIEKEAAELFPPGNMYSSDGILGGESQVHSWMVVPTSISNGEIELWVTFWWGPYRNVTHNSICPFDVKEFARCILDCVFPSVSSIELRLGSLSCLA
jgi:hypothetical protein